MSDKENEIQHHRVLISINGLYPPHLIGQQLPPPLSKYVFQEPTLRTEDELKNHLEKFIPLRITMMPY
jgi:hypothetical protein